MSGRPRWRTCRTGSLRCPAGVAVVIGVPPRRINEILHGTRRITEDTALRLARYFGTSDELWLNLQAHYDMETERERLADALGQIRPLTR